MAHFATSIGLVTSIGYDVRTSCASARAGITRIQEMHHHKVNDGGTHEEAPIAGCPVAPLTDGFGSLGRWTGLGLQAIEDLIDYGNLHSQSADFWAGTALVFALPDLNAPNFDFEGVINESSIKTKFIEPFIVRSGLPIQSKFTLVVSEDDTAVFSACDLVRRCFNNENIDRVLLLAVDSLIEPHRLNWLELTGRLKNPDNPIGVVPGEAAAAVMFESEDSLQSNGHTPLATLVSFATAVEQNHQYQEEYQQNVGDALAKCISDVLAGVPADNGFTGMVFSDLNGEEWRARELSMARLKLSEYFATRELDEILPVASFGDVGTAKPLASLCMLIEGNRRGYLKNKSGLVLGSSAGGSTGAVLIKVCF